MKYIEYLIFFIIGTILPFLVTLIVVSVLATLSSFVDWQNNFSDIADIFSATKIRTFLVVGLLCGFLVMAGHKVDKMIAKSKNK